MAFTDEQLQNARVIAQVGREVGASERDIQIALAVALQESGLRNLNYGDRDSLGLFQQRPSMDWGSRAQVTDPRYAARAFFLGAGTNKGLLDYGQRDSWSLTQAAQRVQRSAYPDAYAKHEGRATELLAAVGGTSASTAAPEASRPEQQRAPQQEQAPGAAAPVAAGTEAVTAPGTQSADQTTAGIVNTASEDPARQPFLPQLSEDEFKQAVAPGATGRAADIIAFAKQYVGTPYKWGGSSPLGFDCSGLLQYVFGKFGVRLPRVSYQQANYGTRVSRDQLQPGDLVAWDNSSRNNGADHVALSLGGGLVLEAPRAGLNVRIRKLGDDENVWGSRVL